MYDWLGYMAAVMTTLAFLPQIIKIYKERSARSISLKTFYIFSSGVFFWFLYGLALRSWPMIIANFVTLVLSVIIVVLKHTYKESK